jgi:hypothetical protein
MGEIRVQYCANCGGPPVLTCDTEEGGHMYNIAHRCPDGTVARGARYSLRDEVVREWNRQQIAIAMKGKSND